jgi:hypothetical protein
MEIDALHLRASRIRRYRRLRGHVPGDEGAARGAVRRTDGAGPRSAACRRSGCPARGDGVLYFVYAVAAAAGE